ncbi:MAG: glycosyltransferase family 4 protein [Vicinamibacterales bacterium]
MLRIVDTIDVFSQKGSNVIAYGIGDAETPAHEEARLLNRADLVVAIHEADAAALRALAPNRQVVVAGVDADVHAGRPWPSRPVALLPGSGNPLNVAGLRDFLKLAWPRVRAAVPDAELRVAGKVGRAVPAGVPGVIALGHVPDLADAYAACRVVINPAVAGTGLKIKSVEALAHLRPVVGWPHNRDGLSDVLAPFVHESGDWQDFADAVIDALRRPASPFDTRATDIVRTALSAETAYGRLDASLRRFFHAADADPGA